MPHSLSWQRKTGQDKWQKPTFGAPTSMRGLVYEDEHQVSDANGVKRTARGVVYLDDVYGIGTEDDVLWDGQRLGDIIRVESFSDEDGPYTSVVHYG